jgi:Zn-dependent protease
MGRSWRVARINSAPVEVHWLFAPLLLWTAYVGWSQGGVAGALYGLALLVIMFVCILLHEVGHTLQAQAVGIPVRRILLLPFGGLAQLTHLPQRPQDELRVALAGPLVTLGLTLVTGGLLLGWLASGQAPLPSWNWLLFEVLRGPSGALHFLATLFFINASLFALNALPAFPLDGARILRSLLALALPRPRATWVVSRLGWVLGALCLVLAASLARFWGQPVALSLFATGIVAVFGAGVEEAFERGQTVLKNLLVRDAVRQPTWFLQPTQVLTPGLLAALEALDRPVWPVVQEARLVGLLSRRDLSVARACPRPLTVGRLMQRDFMHVDVSLDLWRAQQMLLVAGQDSLAVLDGERLHGMLTSADIRAACVAPPSFLPSEATQLISSAQLTL